MILKLQFSASQDIHSSSVAVVCVVNVITSICQFPLWFLFG